MPTERRFNFLPYAFGTLLLLAAIAGIWWLLVESGILFGGGGSPTGSGRVVELELSGQKFAIPENYLRNPDQRSGGEVDQIDIHALWPSMSGFSDSLADDFRDKTTQARVIYVTLTAPTQIWRPAERFYQVYPYYFAGPEMPAEHGLMTRAMDPGSGIADHDVLYLQGTEHLILFHCLRDKPDLMPADCVGDKVVEPRVLARYRFRRSLLGNWREIDASVEKLLARFLKP